MVDLPCVSILSPHSYWLLSLILIDTYIFQYLHSSYMLLLFDGEIHRASLNKSIENPLDIQYKSRKNP